MSKSAADRLSSKVCPTRYAIDLTIRPEEKDFFGTVCIDLNIESPLETFALHTLDLKIEKVTLGSMDGKISKNLASETILLSFPETIPQGNAVLSLDFSGYLNRQMRGLYETRSGGETFAFTQFEATDARRMFPCFDEPDFKSRFSLSVTVPADLVALSNMPVIDEKSLGAVKTVTFDETPVMSTYLLALAVARLEKTEMVVGETLVTVWTLPDQIALGAFSLKVASAVLPLLIAYFDFPCPTPKLDLISVPDFAMGAMENWGAIFFRDSCLLLDEEASSTATQRAVASVITHEIVHQWFGNLVTMVWWDDLWLNESFATWLACKIIDQWRPEWHVWVSFQQEKEIPLDLDALENSRAIQADVASPAEIDEMFDVLTYEKGAACLRMIEQFLGEDAFCNGIRTYMKQYQYKNATASDLWSALETASNQPVSEIAKDWFTRPGFPIIKIASAENDFSILHLSQQRFTAGEQRATPPWSVPLCIKYCDDKGIQTDRVLLKEQATQFILSAKGKVHWVYGNAGETGFYRTDYDPNLIRGLPEIAAKSLSPTEKIGFLGNLWALSRRGDCPISSFMEALCCFKGDQTRVVIEDSCAYLELLYNQIIMASDRARFSAFVFQQMNPVWKIVGWDSISGEDDEKQLIRSDLLWVLGAIAQDEEILSELPRRQTRYFAKPNSINPTLALSLIRLCAHSDGGTRFEQFLDRFNKSTTPELRDRYLVALTDFNKPALARRVLDFALSEKVRSQDVWKPVRALLSKPVVQAETWDYLKSHWLKFLEKGGNIGAQRMIQATRNLWSIEWHDEVQTFFEDPGNRAQFCKRTLAQTLEFIRLGIQFKRQQTADLSGWLQKNVKDDPKKVF